ncbi:MAG: hypothetical protein DMF17_11145 [Verrucomicrobia bacterium]|nr:MAG: hypothetical protein DMF17_11145 [Verrucomicrobiota bacterium]
MGNRGGSYLTFNISDKQHASNCENVTQPVSSQVASIERIKEAIARKARGTGGVVAWLEGSMRDHFTEP